MAMTLGSVTFEKEPSDFDIPEKYRKAAVLNTYGGVAFYSFGVFIEGKEIEIHCPAMSVSQFDDIQDLLEADEPVVWNPDDGKGKTYNVEILSLQGKYHMSKSASADYRSGVIIKVVIISEV